MKKIKPAINYNKELKITGSFEELSEIDAKAAAARTPRENLLIAHEQNRQLHKEELKKPMDKKIRLKYE